MTDADLLDQAAAGQMHADLCEPYPWFVPRMMTDEWCFGLLVSDSLALAVTSITAIRRHGGIVWLDVDLATEAHTEVQLADGLRLMFAPFPDRVAASVRADAVIAAFELSTG